MAYTADKLIEIAMNEVGYLEKKSNSQLDDKTANAGYNNWTKYARDLYAAGYYNGNKNGYAWCDCFVDWLFLKLCNGDAAKAEWLICQTGDYGAGCTYSMRYYKNAGRFYTSPKVGDQIFFGSSSNSSHTGIVYKVDSSRVYTIEGNTSSTSGVVANGGGVFKKSYALNYSRIAGYGRPRYDESEQTSTDNTYTEQTTPTPSRSYIMKGDKGSEVKTMQENLIKLGYSCGSSGADGDFGSATDSAVRKFQKENGLTVDGKYGSQSKAKVNELLAKMNAPVQTTGKIDTVKEVQNWANTNYKSGLVVDGVYGAQTKKALIKILQTELNQTYSSKLSVDGIFGNQTKAACPTLKNGSKNDVVGVLQALLICNGYSGAYLDKDYGNATTTAVKSYQKKKGLVVDGIAGKNTFAKLCM